jgi:hypothetical protein
MDSSYIPRTYLTDLRSELVANRKIILLFGPRQVGKTTLAKQILADLPLRCLEINADINPYREVLSSRDVHRLAGLVEGFDLLFIDEAQRIPDIGINLKILHDEFPDLKLMITGSSSLELANQTREALTGRTLSYLLFPIAIQELRNLYSPFELQQRLETYLIFGMYPEILSIENHQRKTRYLRELVSAYLYKDLLELTNIKHADKLTDLLRLLAFQIGSQVSVSELGQQLGLARETVESYLDLLEKSFVIFRLRGFSRNLRKEVSKMSKYYFYDLGVRNMLIENFHFLNQRNDVGQLWENFLMVERKKKRAYEFSPANQYFWRTYDRQELDYLEESGGQLHAFEFKYRSTKAKVPQAWKKAYPAAGFSVIHSENYLDFLS